MELEVSIDGDRSLDRLVERAEAGEEIVLTRDGRAVARIVPKTIDRSEAAAAMERILQIGKGVSLGGLRFSDLINEGRKY